MKHVPVGNELLILTLLEPGEWMNGTTLVYQAKGELNRNSVYTVLTRMKARGLVKTRGRKGGGCEYAITFPGRTALKTARAVERVRREE